MYRQGLGMRHGQCDRQCRLASVLSLALLGLLLIAVPLDNCRKNHRRQLTTSITTIVIELDNRYHSSELRSVEEVNHHHRSSSSSHNCVGFLQ